MLNFKRANTTAIRTKRNKLIINFQTSPKNHPTKWVFLAFHNLFFKTDAFSSKQNLHWSVYIRFSGRSSPSKLIGVSLPHPWEFLWCSFDRKFRSADKIYIFQIVPKMACTFFLRFKMPELILTEEWYFDSC